MPIKGKTGTPARLASGIRGRICKNDNGEDFIPNDAIDELASLENVQHHLEAKPQHLKGASVDTFMNFVADQKKPAKKVFLILVYCDLLEYLSSMCEVGFCDQYLPIEPKWNEPQDRYDVRTKHWQKPEPFNKWSTGNIEIFEAKQWVFMAPVFNAHQFEYTVSPKCPLPIIGRPGHSKGGYSGSVREVEIHKAHLQVFVTSRTGTCKRIALKEIHDDKQDYYKKELESLSMIRPLRHSHLIQPLAAYTRVRLQGFLFPWAEGGNLEEFWRRDTKLAAADRGLMRWVLHQLCGLCGATKKLHTKNCRHTDLKPANILLFRENGYPKTPGTLRIADVGLAKIHDDETRQRKAITQAKTGSVRYEPPELGREDQLSRVYDVWCLGCVFLEFLIWGVYGWKFFSDFSNNTRQLQFWEQTADGEIQQHQHVKTIIAKMFRDLKSGNTKRQSALEDCLELVDKRMLVPNWREREVVARLHTDLERIRKKGNEKEGYLLNRRLTSNESKYLAK
ncbi:kinase-like protein [Colletotrichum sublineola]|nr:kinase-like protein [Colletotrichum sublineola]